jgi:hypothetical protein
MEVIKGEGRGTRTMTVSQEAALIKIGATDEDLAAYRSFDYEVNWGHIMAVAAEM